MSIHHVDVDAIRAGSLSLRRYEKQFGEVRKQVPILLTREVFRRLLTDFAAVK